MNNHNQLINSRDLAARNCLLLTFTDDSDINFIVKIGDFGLAR